MSRYGILAEEQLYIEQEKSTDELFGCIRVMVKEEGGKSAYRVSVRLGSWLMCFICLLMAFDAVAAPKVSEYHLRK